MACGENLADNYFYLMKQELKTITAMYQTLLLVAIGAMVTVAAAGGILVMKWARQGRVKIDGASEKQLMSQEFIEVESQLGQRQELVEEEAEILYGRDIGKLEPFAK